MFLIVSQVKFCVYTNYKIPSDVLLYEKCQIQNKLEHDDFYSNKVSVKFVLVYINTITYQKTEKSIGVCNYALANILVKIELMEQFIIYKFKQN